MMGGRWSGVRGKGQAIAFLRGLVGHQGEECVPWPMSRNHNGHGACSWNGKLYLAHRMTCELEHGPAPDGHEAAHSCGNGHEGCVNPRHLSWKTRAENQHDRYVHLRKPKPPMTARVKLTAAQVEQIRALAGTTTNKALAEMFGVSRGNIRLILTGQTWGPDTKRLPEFTPDDIAKIRRPWRRGDCDQLAREYGVHPQVIWRIHRGKTFAYL